MLSARRFGNCAASSCRSWRQGEGGGTAPVQVGDDVGGGFVKLPSVRCSVEASQGRMWSEWMTRATKRVYWPSESMNTDLKRWWRLAGSQSLQTNAQLQRVCCRTFTGCVLGPSSTHAMMESVSSTGSVGSMVSL